MIEDKVRRVLSIVFQRPVGPEETPAAEATAEWDSLAHMELIFALEEEFSVRFSKEDMEQMTSFNAIVERLRGNDE